MHSTMPGFLHYDCLLTLIAENLAHDWGVPAKTPVSPVGVDQSRSRPSLVTTRPVAVYVSSNHYVTTARRAVGQSTHALSQWPSRYLSNGETRIIIGDSQCIRLQPIQVKIEEQNPRVHGEGMTPKDQPKDWRDLLPGSELAQHCTLPCRTNRVPASMPAASSLVSVRSVLLLTYDKSRSW